MFGIHVGSHQYLIEARLNKIDVVQSRNDVYWAQCQAWISEHQSSQQIKTTVLRIKQLLPPHFSLYGVYLHMTEAPF